MDFAHEYSRIYGLMKEAADNGYYRIRLNKYVSDKTVCFLKKHGFAVNGDYAKETNTILVREISWWEDPLV